MLRCCLTLELLKCVGPVQYRSPVLFIREQHGSCNADIQGHLFLWDTSFSKNVLEILHLLILL